MPASRPRAEIVVDLDAYRHNLAVLTEHLAATAAADPAPLLMAVVKADAYGHGMRACARAARAAGVPWLGVATPDEALALRADGDTGRLLCWLAVPDEDLSALVAADVDVTVATTAQLDRLVAGLVVGSAPARVQLKVDTGLSRGGATAADWPEVVAAAAAAERTGAVRVTGVWSHLASADTPDDPANDAQEQAFRDALAVAAAAGLRPEVRHLANSAAALLRPSAHFDLVRCGIATYGLDPAPTVPPADRGPGGGPDLRPVMTARARLALVKRVDAGTGVSYGHHWVAPAPTVLGLVPVGYGEGVPRAATLATDHGGPGAEVLVGGRRAPLCGRVCMDQVVVDLGPDAPDRPGDEVVLFGAGPTGAPTADEWAAVCGTINYEIVTRIGGRFTRTYAGQTQQTDQTQQTEQTEQTGQGGTA